MTQQELSRLPENACLRYKGFEELHYGFLRWESGHPMYHTIINQGYDRWEIKNFKNYSAVTPNEFVILKFEDAIPNL